MIIALIEIFIEAAIGTPIANWIDNSRKEMDDSECYTEIHIHANACECWSILKSTDFHPMPLYPTRRTTDIIGGSLRTPPNLSNA